MHKILHDANLKFPPILHATGNIIHMMLERRYGQSPEHVSARQLVENCLQNGVKVRKIYGYQRYFGIFSIWARTHHFIVPKTGEKIHKNLRFFTPNSATYNSSCLVRCAHAQRYRFLRKVVFFTDAAWFGSCLPIKLRRDCSIGQLRSMGRFASELA